jgi:hypothetical protein
MSQPEPEPAPGRPFGRRPYGTYVGALAVLIFVLVAINTVVTKQSGLHGIEPGHRLPPFAVPLVLSDVSGDSDVATHANDGAAGRVPACQERGPAVLNVCQLYEQGPLVLALFIDAGSCPQVLGDMQALAPSFPGVHFAAVAIKGDRAQLRTLVRTMHLSFPVGIDRDGALAGLYKLVSCPQLSFAYPGGVVQSRALELRPPRALLAARVRQLVAAARARGWRGAPT